MGTASQGEQSGRLAVTRREAARLLSVSEGMIRKMQSAGELSQVKVGTCARVPYAELLNLASGDRDDSE